MESIWHDLSWVLPLRSDGATAVMRVFTWIGYSTFYMLFLPLGFWLWRKPAFTRLAVIVAISGVLNVFLKDFWQDPRPDIAMSLDSLVAGSFGMPSGHAQTSTVLWLWLATEVRRSWMWAVAVIMIAGIAASRLYLGVHDVEDVAVGFALGVMMLAVGKAAMRITVTPYLALALMLLAGQAVVFTLWPGSPGSATGFGAFAVAWLVGATLEARYVAYTPADRWRKFVAGALGVAILMGLFVGLKKAAEGIDPDGDVAMYVATFAIGLYMTFGAPWLFWRLGLAGPRASLHGAPET
jgi:membrane-associated phospholipid phosphatase